MPAIAVSTVLNAPEIESWAGLRQPVSALTHWAFVPFLFFVSSLLVRLCHGHRARQWSLACFGFTACLLYSVSGTYHAVQRPAHVVDLLRRADLSAIFLLIAGSCTPAFVTYLRGRLRTVMLILIWSAALVGCAGKWLPLPDSKNLTIAIYFGVAALGMIPLVPLARALGTRGTCFFLLGAILYAIGGICHALCWPVLIPGVFQAHEMLHVMDLAGTTTHVIFYFQYVVPRRE